MKRANCKFIPVLALVLGASVSVLPYAVERRSLHRMALACRPRSLTRS